MANWISTPLKLPDSAPEEIRQATTRWKRSEVHQTQPSAPDADMDMDYTTSAPNPSSGDQPATQQGVINEIIDTVFDKPDNSQPDETTPAEHASTQKRNRTPDASLNAALARLYPAKELYHVKTAHITDGNQWHPTVPPTQRYTPAMRQPLDRQIHFEDHGLTAEKNGKVPHETVLDYLVDIMRNKHWRGAINNTISSIPTLNRDPWPRTHYEPISRIIASNPFLLRLAQMLEGRFHEAAVRNLPYVPSVSVQGLVNKAVTLEARYIAAILVQTLGRENAVPCSLCAGDWNSPRFAPDEEQGEMRPFEKCVSLYSIALPARFKACGNHFWNASITDCGCVDLTAPLHPDERYEYIYDTFSPLAENYLLVKSSLEDEFLKIMPAIPDGWVAFGPFAVRSDVAANSGLFAYGLDRLMALVEWQRDRGGNVGVRSEGSEELWEVLERM